MENVQVIKKKNHIFGEVRFVVIDNKEYAVANDIARALGYSKPNNAINTHCKHATLKQGIIKDTLGRYQDTNLIPEGDIYRLICNSKLPQAEKFESWVFDEVLPSIRNNGMYATDELLDNPDLLIKVATKLKEEKERNRQLKEEIKEKDQLIKHIEVSEGSILVRELAKIACKNGIDIGEKRLWNKLREWGLIMKNSTEPKQAYISCFEVVARVIACDNGDNKTQTLKQVRTTKVTPRGQLYIIQRLLKENIVL